jgi:PAS domain S-box-containing protein
MIWRTSTVHNDRISNTSLTGTQHLAETSDSDSEGEYIDSDSREPALPDDLLSSITREIISTARQGIIVFDRQLRYLLWNPFMEEISGLSSQNVLGRHHSDLFPFVKERGLDLLLERALGGERVSAYDFAYYVPDTGKSGWASASYGPLRDLNGAIVGVIAVVQDITSLKLAEEALNQSEERFKNVVESATDIIYMLSIDGAIISLNYCFETLTGWSRAAWMGKSFLGLLHPDDVPVAVESFRRVFRGEATQPIEVRFLTNSGDYLVCECTATPRIKNRGVVAASGIIRDITARKRMEEALKKAERDYRGIFENALDGIFRCTPDGRFVLVNSALAKILGYDSPEELIESGDANRLRFYKDPDRRADYEHLMKENGAVEGFEGEAFRVDGRVIWISENCRSVRGPDGEVLYFEGSIRDITEQRSAEEALRKSEMRYRSLVENIIELVSTTDSATSVADLNRKLRQALDDARRADEGR